MYSVVSAVAAAAAAAEDHRQWMVDLLR